MCQILHLFRIEKFTEGFIQFVNENFDKDSHEFWIYGYRDINIKINVSVYKNVKYVKDIEKKIQSKQIYNFDKIIYHGVFEQKIINCFYRNKKLLKRLYLYFWGGDKFLHENGISKYKKKYVVNHAHGIINIIPEEKQYMKKNYNIRGKFFCALYYSKSIVENLKRCKTCQSEDRNYIAIQVGNSATPSNNHISILKKLEKFRDKNVRIFVPLSYGDKIYRERVLEFGGKIFGDKFIGITEFMAEDIYYEFMSNIDIAIFNMGRQQALGNINALLYFGKKVFLKKRSVLAHYFTKECHCNIEFVEDIQTMNFEEFIQISEEGKLNNEKRIEEHYQIEPRKSQWKKIFDEKLG